MGKYFDEWRGKLGNKMEDAGCYTTRCIAEEKIVKMFAVACMRVSQVNFIYFSMSDFLSFQPCMLTL